LSSPNSAMTRLRLRRFDKAALFSGYVSRARLGGSRREAVVHS
jgi:hypothetical protein